MTTATIQNYNYLS